MKFNSFKIFGKRLSSNAILRERTLLHQARDWMIGLGVAATLFLLATAYLGYDFYVYLNSDKNNVAEDVPLVEYRHEEVKEILKRYEEQAKNFEKLRNDRSNYIVPVPETEPLADEDTEQYSGGAAPSVR